MIFNYLYNSIRMSSSNTSTGYTVNEINGDYLPLFSVTFDGEDISGDDTVYELKLDGKIILFLVLPTDLGEPKVFSSRKDVYKVYPQLQQLIESQDWMGRMEDQNVDQSHRYVVAGGKLLGYLAVNVGYDNSRTFFTFSEDEVSRGEVDEQYHTLIHPDDGFWSYPESILCKMQSFTNTFCVSKPEVSNTLLHNASTQAMIHVQA
jgi:hypothetical protein